MHKTGKSLIFPLNPSAERGLSVRMEAASASTVPGRGGASKGKDA